MEQVNNLTEQVLRAVRGEDSPVEGSLALLWVQEPHKVVYLLCAEIGKLYEQVVENYEEKLAHDRRNWYDPYDDTRCS